MSITRPKAKRSEATPNSGMPQGDKKQRIRPPETLSEPNFSQETQRLHHIFNNINTNPTTDVRDFPHDSKVSEVNMHPTLLKVYFKPLTPLLKASENKYKSICLKIQKAKAAVKKLQDQITEGSIAKGLKIAVKPCFPSFIAHKNDEMNQFLHSTEQKLMTFALEAQKEAIQTLQRQLVEVKDDCLAKIRQLLTSCPEEQARYVLSRAEDRLSLAFQKIEVSLNMQENRKRIQRQADLAEEREMKERLLDLPNPRVKDIIAEEVEKTIRRHLLDPSSLSSLSPESSSSLHSKRTRNPPPRRGVGRDSKTMAGTGGRRTHRKHTGKKTPRHKVSSTASKKGGRTHKKDTNRQRGSSTAPRRDGRKQTSSHQRRGKNPKSGNSKNSRTTNKKNSRPRRARPRKKNEPRKKNSGKNFF